MWRIAKNAFDKYIGAHNSDISFYAINDEYEFASEFITNSSAREIIYGLFERLDNDSQNKFVTAFKNFINSIVRLFVNKDLFKTNT